MATRIYEPDPTLTAQVVTVTLGGAILEGETFTLTVEPDELTGDEVTVTAPATPTTEEVIDLIVAAWTDARWVLAKTAATTFTITAATAGAAFYVKVATNSVGGTIVAALTTPNASPSDWNCATNWSDDTAPVDGDTVVFVGTTTADSITQGLLHDGETTLTGTWVPSVASIVLAGIRRHNSMNGALGTATLPLRIRATTVDIGQANGGAYAAGRVNLDLGNVSSTINVHGPESSIGDITISIKHNTAKIHVWTGTVSMSAVDAMNLVNEVIVGDGATLTSDLLSIAGASPIAINFGGTLTFWDADVSSYTLLHIAGTTTISGTSTCSLLNCFGGTVRFKPDDAAIPVTTANVYGGAAYIVGSVTTLNVYPDAVADFRSATSALTVTTINAYYKAIVRYDPSVVTVTNPYLTKAFEVTMQA